MKNNRPRIYICHSGLLYDQINVIHAKTLQILKTIALQIFQAGNACCVKNTSIVSIKSLSVWSLQPHHSGSRPASLHLSSSGISNALSFKLPLFHSTLTSSFQIQQRRRGAAKPGGRGRGTPRTTGIPRRPAPHSRWGRDLEVRGGGVVVFPQSLGGGGSWHARFWGASSARGNTTTPAPWFSRPPSSLLTNGVFEI